MLPILRGISVAAVILGGEAVAAVLLWLVLRLTLFGAREPTRTYASILLLIGLGMIPAAPAVGAWLTAHYGWAVATWVLGILAAGAAIAVLVWVIGMVTLS